MTDPFRVLSRYEMKSKSPYSTTLIIVPLAPLTFAAELPTVVATLLQIRRSGWWCHSGKTKYDDLLVPIMEDAYWMHRRQHFIAIMLRIKSLILVLDVGYDFDLCYFCSLIDVWV